MNALDLILLVIVGVFALRGFRQGFAAGVLNVAGFVFTFAAAFLLYHRVAPVIGHFTNLSPSLSKVAAFLLLFIIATFVWSLVGYSLLTRLFPDERGGVVRGADSVLGVIPGAVQGALIAACIVIALEVVPFNGLIGAELRESSFAPMLRNAASSVTPQIHGLLSNLPRTSQRFP